MIRKLEKWSCWTSEDVFLWNCMKAKLEHHHQWSPDQPGCRKNLESSARCSVLRGSQHAPRCQTCISGQQLLSEKVKIPCWPVLSQSGHTHIGVIKPQRYGADPQLDHFEPEQWSCFPMIKKQCSRWASTCSNTYISPRIFKPRKEYSHLSTNCDEIVLKSHKHTRGCLHFFPHQAEPSRN